MLLCISCRSMAQMRQPRCKWACHSSSSVDCCSFKNGTITAGRQLHTTKATRRTQAVAACTALSPVLPSKKRPETTSEVAFCSLTTAADYEGASSSTDLALPCVTGLSLGRRLATRGLYLGVRPRTSCGLLVRAGRVGAQRVCARVRSCSATRKAAGPAATGPAAAGPAAAGPGARSSPPPAQCRSAPQLWARAAPDGSCLPAPAPYWTVFAVVERGSATGCR